VLRLVLSGGCILRFVVLASGRVERWGAFGGVRERGGALRASVGLGEGLGGVGGDAVRVSGFGRHICGSGTHGDLVVAVVSVGGDMSGPAI